MGLLRRQQGDRDRGSMAVEFALAAPVLVVLVLGIADFGSWMNTNAALRGATRAGAEYVLANWTNPAVSNSTLITNAETQVCQFLYPAASSNSCSPVSSNVSWLCTCSDGSTAATPCPPSGSNSCATAFPSDPRVFVSAEVTASQSVSPMLAWPGFPSTASASTTVRTQ